jgi:photosystem II stability/assembly factor-like uncharacterized protein
LKPVHKICVFLFLFLVQISANAQGKWNKIDVPTKVFLKSLCFTDSLYGWAAGDSGVILHTSDGGTTWITQNSGTKNEISALFCLDRNRGWASSINFTVSPFGTILLKTTNGGINWTGTSYPDPNIFITCILFRDSLNGWMGGRPHALVKTTNGGADWIQAEIDTSVLAFFPVLSIKFYNNKYGYACGGMFDIAGVIWRTSNGGDKWFAMDPSEAPADEVHELHLFDSLHVIGAGGDPDFGYGVGMIHTSDGGLSWNYQPLGMQGTAYDIAFRNPSEVWSPLGMRGTLIYSLDAGNTWTEIPAPDSAAIFKLTFPDSLHGWAVGRDGAVLKFIPASPGGINPGPATDQHAVILYQNIPNPFSSYTDIRFRIPVSISPVPVTIKVYNILGTEVATLVDGEFPPGDYKTTFNAMTQPGGIYFYCLTGNTSGKAMPDVAPRKMILMK